MTNLVAASFSRVALAFPDSVRATIATIENPQDAAKALRGGDAILRLAKDLGARTEEVNAIHWGRLLLIAKLGELLPAKQGERSDLTSCTDHTKLDFNSHTIAAYRKVTKWRKGIDTYCDSAEEVSMAGFIRWNVGIARDKKDKGRAAKRRRAAKAIGVAKTIKQALRAAKFSTICIDPPWDFKDEGDNSQLGRGNTTYGSMTHDELLAFPVGQYAERDSHIYLWITNRSLPKGFSLLEAWGFRYVTCLTWCKPSIGMGNYFRGATEQILFGIRGSLQLKRKDAPTWFLADRGKRHSQKPEEFYGMVESCSHAPYLDIFSRAKRDNWTCWGGQL